MVKKRKKGITKKGAGKGFNERPQDARTTGASTIYGTCSEPRQGDAHEIMRFMYRIEIIDALKPIVHLFELPYLPLTGLDLISFLL